MTIPVSFLPYVNIFLIAFIVLMLLYGFFKGFLLQLFSILIFIAISIVSWLIAPSVAKVFPLMASNDSFNVLPIIGPFFQQTINTILWFIIIVFGLMVISLFFKPVLKGIGKLPIIKTVNQILGMLLAGLKAFVALVVLMLILGSGLFRNGQTVINNSILSQLKPVTFTIVSAISNKLDPSGLISKVMTGQEFTPDEVVSLNAWLTTEGIPTAIVPVLSKVLRLQPVNSVEITTLIDWMRANGISEADLQKFLEHFK